MDKQTSADDVARELKEIGAEISQKYYGQMRYWAAGNSLPWECTAISDFAIARGETKCLETIELTS